MKRAQSVGELFVAVRSELQLVGIAEPRAEIPAGEPESVAEEVRDDALEEFDKRILHPDLIALCRKDFEWQDYAGASRKATQYLNQEVHTRCLDELIKRNAAKVKGTTKKPAVVKDGVSLMQQVFAVEDPVLRIPPAITTASEQSEQIGYGFLMQGVIGAFRNPRSHDVFFEDDPLVALLIVELVQHLLEVAGNAALIESK